MEVNLLRMQMIDLNIESHVREYADIFRVQLIQNGDHVLHVYSMHSNELELKLILYRIASVNPLKMAA